MNGFFLERNKAHEENAVACYCVLNRIPFKNYSKEQNTLPEGFVPIGSAEWFAKITGFNFGEPDYYPEFAAHLLKRKIWKADKWPIQEEKVFIKPSDRVKRFTGKITSPNSYKGKKRGPYWCSEVVPIVDEFRYYVTDGKIVDAYWYLGEDDDAVIPELELDFPIGWCGSIDIATTEDRGLVIIEAHEPYAVGWYGSLNNGKTYAQWCIDGYEYLRKKYEEKR